MGPARPLRHVRGPRELRMEYMFSASMSNNLPKSSSLFGTSAKYGRCSEIIRASCDRNIQAGKKA